MLDRFDEPVARPSNRLEIRADKVDTAAICLCKVATEAVESKRMNRFVLNRFAPEILLGMESLGYELMAVAKLLGITSQRLARINSSLSSFTSKHGKIIEEATDRSVGELAVLGMEYRATPDQRTKNAKLTKDTLEMLAAGRQPSKPRRTGRSAGITLKHINGSRKRSTGKSRAA